MVKLPHILFAMLLSAATSYGLTFTVAYKNFAQTFIVQHTWNPTIAGAPFIIGPNATDIEVAGLRAQQMTTLSTNPANCPAGQIISGVDASGVAEGCVNVTVDEGGGLMRYPGTAGTCRWLANGQTTLLTTWGTCNIFTINGTLAANATSDTESVSVNATTSSDTFLYGPNGNAVFWFGTIQTVLDIQAGMQETGPTVRYVLIGFSNAASVTLALQTDLPADDIAGFRWHSNIDTTWKCLTGDGTTSSVTDSLVTVDTAMHFFRIEANAAQTFVKFYIDGSLVCNKTTNIPGSITKDQLFFLATGRNTAGPAGATGLRVADVYISQGTDS